MDFWRKYSIAPVDELPKPALVVILVALLFSIASYSRDAIKTISPSVRVDLEKICDYPGLRTHVPPGTRTLCLDGLYGLAMAYHGWGLAEYWPTGPDYIGEFQQTGMVVPLPERFRNMLAEHKPTRFVITSKPHLALDQELGERLKTFTLQKSRLPEELQRPEWDILLFLRQNFPRVAESPNWIVYDLTRTKTQ
ncbi:MAG: hypothetical protein U1D30_23510 [Planctomycetota bacterium]